MSPSFCFRDKWTYASFLTGQVCFLKKLALPAVVTLNSIPWLDVNQLVNGIEKNIAEWEEQGDCCLLLARTHMYYRICCTLEYESVCCRTIMHIAEIN